MFREKVFIEFFYKHDQHIDMINESIRRLIAANGGKKTEIAKKLGITPQFLGQLASGERKKPNAELVQKIREVYGVDILSGETSVSANETTFTLPLEAWLELKQNNSNFMTTVMAFTEALSHLKEDKTKLYGIIDRLLSERSQAAQQG